MTVKETLPFFSIDSFTASKHIRFLESLKRLRFSGELVLTDPKGQQWNFYLNLGSIFYATGGTHCVRRWQRNLAVYCPQMLAHSLVLPHELAGFNAVTITTDWQYQRLWLWIEHKKITSEQAAQMIRAVVTEVLFDVAQARRAVHQINYDNFLATTPLVSIDVQQAIVEVQQLWQSWQSVQLAEYSPNSAPTIKQLKQLQQRTSPQVYQSLTKLLDGQHTLRDLALLMKRDVLQVTRSLQPYIRAGLVELQHIPDLPTPVSPPVPKTPATPAASSKPLVACIDDSPLVCQTMQTLLVAAGYEFVGVEDALRAIAVLLARKPDAIFLDLVMPNTNGYEICSKLRKLDCFRNTPIVILTGNDGIVDRVRAKLVGASDFLSKPIDAGTVLSVLRKYLERGAISS